MPVAGQSSFRYYPRPGQESRMNGGKVQVSNDASSWTDLYTIPSTPTSGTYTVADFPYDISAYLYVRYLTPANGYGNVSEIQFYRGGYYSSGGTLVPPTVQIGEPSTNGNPVGNAFDSNTTSYYEGGQNTGYVGIDMRPIVGSFRFYPRVGWTSRMPGGMFQGSNDYTPGTLTSGTWTTIGTIQSTPTDSAWNVLDVPINPGNYRWIRYVDPVNGFGNVAEITVYKNASYNSGGTLMTPLTLFGSTNGTTGNTYDKAWDGNTSTYYDTSNASGGNITGADFGAPVVATNKGRGFFLF